MEFEQVAAIKVVGVGGAGNNAINRMIEAGIQGVDFIAANTDAQVISVSKAPTKLILGKELSKGLGAGANPEIGKKAALESENEIRSLLKDADMVFVAAGMGGGTGTGAAPIIAKIAKENGALTIAIVTRPFKFEGRLRNSYAIDGLEELRKNVDSLIVVSNDRLINVIGDAPLKDSFKEADNVLRQAVQSITDIVAVPALINLDFADVRTITENKGDALIGIGIGKGESRAEEAALKAIKSPLLEASITGATAAIVNVTGGSSMSLYDAQEAVDIVKDAAGQDINIIFGVALNDHLDDEMIVTVIATGFNQQDRSTDDLNLNRSSSSTKNSTPNNINIETQKKNNAPQSLQDKLYKSANDEQNISSQKNNKFSNNNNENDLTDDDLPDFLKQWG